MFLKQINRFRDFLVRVEPRHFQHDYLLKINHPIPLSLLYRVATTIIFGDTIVSQSDWLLRMVVAILLPNGHQLSPHPLYTPPYFILELIVKSVGGGFRPLPSYLISCMRWFYLDESVGGIFTQPLHLPKGWLQAQWARSGHNFSRIYIMGFCGFLVDYSPFFVRKTKKKI